MAHSRVSAVIDASSVNRSPYLLPVLLACASLTVMAGATIAPGLPGLVKHYADYPDADYLARFILTAPGLAIALSASVAGWAAQNCITSFMANRVYVVATCI